VTDILLVIAVAVVMAGVHALGEVSMYRRGGDVYGWTKWLDKHIARWWK